MKWVKFLQEFELSASLKELTGQGGLQKLPKTTTNAGDPNIWISKEPDSIIDKCFRIYNDPTALNAVLDKDKQKLESPSRFHPWVYHGKDYNKLPDRYFEEEYFETKKLKKISTDPKSVEEIEFGKNHPYEIFVGGWVHFYDEQVRHGETDHALYFDWNKNAKSVTIYILQTKLISSWNVYVKVNPPGSQDPPPTTTPPPSC